MTVNQDNTVTVSKGYGYWDLSSYPWGGDFHRFPEDITLPITRVIDRYKDGSPRRFEADYNGKKVGLQCST